MADLYNVSTRQPEQVPDNMVDQALASGTHSYPAGTQVSLKGPDGGYASIPAENIHYALSQGYRVFTPTLAGIDQAVQDNSGPMGTAKVFGSQLIDQLGLGIPELIYKKTGDPMAVAQYEAIKKDHEMANILGNTLGFAGSLVTGGPVFKGAAKVGDVVAGQIAGRLAAETAGQVGTRTLRNVAADIAGKIGGGSAEGLALFAPHAATEAALGDPEQAGETMLAGLGMGALFGAGGQVAKGLLGLGKAGLEKTGQFLGEAPLTIQKGAQVAAETLTGVEGSAIPKYLENPERINAAPSIEQTMDQIDNHVSNFQQEIDNSKLAVDNTKREQQEAYRFGLQDLRKQMAPEDLRNEVMTALDAQKANLGDMSERADQMIADSGVSFEKQDLVDSIRKIASSVGAGPGKTLIGDEAVGAVNKLKTLESRVSQLPDVIDGPSMRDVMRQVRKDINWNTSAGEFNDTLNKLRKSFTENISGLLKDKVDGYGDLMRQMSEQSETLEKMSQSFGTPQKADSNLYKAVTPRGRIEKQLIQEFGAQTGNDFMSKLGNLQKARDLVDRSAVQDVSKEVVPALSERAEQAQQNYLETKQKYDDITSRLGPGRTQSIITRQSYKNASIKDRRALEDLGRLTGDDFIQKIEDRHILDSFDKSSANGSRKSTPGALLGSAVGGLMGGPAGAAVGTAVGAAAGMGLDIYSGKLLKKLLDSRPDISGLLFVEKQMKQVADKLDEIPDILDSLSRKTPSGVQGLGLDLAAQIFAKNEEGKGFTLSRHEAIEKMRDQMANLQANPALFQAKMASYTSPITGGGAPNIGNAFNLKTSNAFNYIFNQMPKPDQPASPFAPKRPYMPSDQQVNTFLQKLSVANNPLVVLDHLKNGTLSTNHMDALKAVYPKLQQTIQQRVMKHVLDGKAKPLPYQNRLRLSMLMDSPVDESQSLQPVFQQMYNVPDQSVDKSQQRSVNLAGNSMTDTQRIESKA